MIAHTCKSGADGDSRFIARVVRSHERGGVGRSGLRSWWSGHIRPGDAARGRAVADPGGWHLIDARMTPDVAGDGPGALVIQGRQVRGEWTERCVTGRRATWTQVAITRGTNALTTHITNGRTTATSFSGPDLAVWRLKKNRCLPVGKPGKQAGQGCPASLRAGQPGLVVKDFGRQECSCSTPCSRLRSWPQGSWC